MRKSFEAVVFDMDGVIIDTEQMYLECWLRVGELHGLENMNVPACASIGVTWEGTLQLMEDFYGNAFCRDSMGQEFYDFAEERFENNDIALKPGIRELLLYLDQEDYKIGLASSSDRFLVEKILKHYDLLHYFDVLTCGDEIEKSKPDPEIYQKSCNHLNVNIEKAIAIEDSFNGIRSAKAAGMIPIMVPDLIGPDQEMKEKSKVVLEDLYQVIDWLKCNEILRK